MRSFGFRTDTWRSRGMLSATGGSAHCAHGRLPQAPGGDQTKCGWRSRASFTWGRTDDQSAYGFLDPVTKSLRKKREVTPGTAKSALEIGVVAISGFEMIFEPLQNGVGTVTLYALGLGVGSKRSRAMMRAGVRSLMPLSARS